MQRQILENLSSSEARAKRIRYIRENLLNLSRAEMCKNSSVNEPSLKSWELAIAGGLTDKGAKRLVERLKELSVHCTTLWLLHGIGYGPTKNPEYLNFSDVEEEQIARELLEFRKQPNAIDTVIKDDCMIPLLYPGNYVAGIAVININNAINKDCIIMTNSGNLLVRKLTLGTEQDRYTLSCLNKQTHASKPEIKDIQIALAAPIIWTRRKNPETEF